MRCKKACEYLSLEIDGLLPPVAAPELEKHLDACSECRSYRMDLQTGKRLLAATEPQLSDNFEWRLQLRLNQSLQEAAGQTAYPWVDPESNSWNWLRNFGTAAAVGMAAVLAFALFLGPGAYETGTPLADSGSSPGGVTAVDRPFSLNLASSAAVTSDRLPLVGGRFENSRLYAGSSQRTVSAGGFLNAHAAPFSLDRGWSGHDVEDLLLIRKLRRDYQQLAKHAYLLQKQLDGMRAQLDTNGAHALDLKLEE